MAVHTFESSQVEEFYNSCHTKADGRFCGGKAKGRGISRVPMSESARRSNAILRRLASDRKSKDYKTAKARIHDTWANREKGQGGLRGVKGHNSKKADAARAKNAIQGVKTKYTKKVVSHQSNKIEFKNDSKSHDMARALTAKYGGRGK